jgi:flagellar basal body P-ring protein FlgI
LLDSLDWPDRDAILQRLVAEATGKTAGQEPDMVNQMGQQMQQMGVDPQMIMQLVQQMQQNGGQQPSQPENYGIMR